MVMWVIVKTMRSKNDMIFSPSPALLVAVGRTVDALSLVSLATSVSVVKGIFASFNSPLTESGIVCRRSISSGVFSEILL